MSHSVEEAGEYIENLKLAEKRNPVTTIQAIQQYKQQRSGPNRPMSKHDMNRKVIICEFISYVRLFLYV